LFNRFTDKEDNFNNPAQKLYFQNNFMLKSIPIALIVFSIAVLGLSDRLTLWHMILITGGIIYSISIIPFFKNKSIHFFRLKDILFVKNFVVSLLWGITPFAIAAAQKGVEIPNRMDLIIIAAAICLTTLMTAIAYDVPDVLGDRQAGVRTIVVIFGEYFTELLLVLIGITGSLFVGALFFLGKANLPTTLLSFIILLWTGIVMFPLFSKRIKLTKALVKPLLDSQCVFCGIALIAYSLVVK
jgi:4-hydroxybenzoate polyprenyltransferase